MFFSALFSEVVHIKTRGFYIKVSDAEYETIKRKAAKSKMTMSRFVLTSVTNKEITVIQVDGLKEIVTELHKIGTNLNQLTRLCHEGRITCLELSAIRNRVSEIWQSLNSLTQKTTKTKT